MFSDCYAFFLFCSASKFALSIDHCADANCGKPVRLPSTAVPEVHIYEMPTNQELGWRSVNPATLWEDNLGNTFVLNIA